MGCHVSCQKSNSGEIGKNSTFVAILLEELATFVLPACLVSFEELATLALPTCLVSFGGLDTLGPPNDNLPTD